jgi:hypothetical protein
VGRAAKPVIRLIVECIFSSLECKDKCGGNKKPRYCGALKHTIINEL